MIRALSVAILAGLSLLPGCEMRLRYPPDLHYPLRKDVLVTAAPGNQPTQLESPGELDQAILAALNRQVGEVKGDGKYLDPAALTGAEKSDLFHALEDVFGTPRLPKVVVAGGELDLNDADLYAGSELYRRHCMHCHGVSGDGRGPTGPWVHPHPRDYRSGLFKFLSTDPKVKPAKPRRDDLHRTIDKGIDGTSMPAFGQNLSPTEVKQIVSYVIHLSIRGETEASLLRYLDSRGKDRKTAEGEIAKEVGKAANRIFTVWLRSTHAPASRPPAAYPDKYTGDDKAKEIAASVRRGHELFIGRAACIGCHNDYGRRSAYRYDAWGTLVRPANLTNYAYRGGRRPIDFYWRISGGIEPSGMSALAPDKLPLKDGKPDLEAYWDLVHFVQALPYPEMLPEDLRGKIYGSSLLIKRPGDEKAKATAKPH